jgi:DNA-binding response OmpR family regulator
MTHVFLVEDDQLISDLYSTILDLNGFKVTRLTDGTEVVKNALKRMPDIIVLDLMMPHVSGMEVLETLKADQKTAGIPVIMFSNLLDTEMSRQALNKGAARYALKSDCPPRVFIDLVKAVLAEAVLKSKASE